MTLPKSILVWREKVTFNIQSLIIRLWKNISRIQSISPSGWITLAQGFPFAIHKEVSKANFQCAIRGVTRGPASTQPGPGVQGSTSEGGCTCLTADITPRGGGTRACYDISSIKDVNCILQAERQVINSHSRVISRCRCSTCVNVCFCVRSERERTDNTGVWRGAVPHALSPANVADH